MLESPSKTLDLMILKTGAAYARSRATGVQDGARNPGMGAFFLKSWLLL